MNKNPKIYLGSTNCNIQVMCDTCKHITHKKLQHEDKIKLKCNNCSSNTFVPFGRVFEDRIIHIIKYWQEGNESIEIIIPQVRLNDFNILKTNIDRAKMGWEFTEPKLKQHEGKMMYISILSIEKIRNTWNYG